MIRVNNYQLDWQEGLTVQKLLDILKEDPSFKYMINSTTTVIINSVVIPDHEYRDRVIQDGDVVLMYPHLLGG